MNSDFELGYLAFEGDVCVAEGDLQKVARAIKSTRDRHADAPILVFDRLTGEQIEFDLRGSRDEVLARLPDSASSPPALEQAAPRGPGRPKLGVVAREITLLPRHWEWLAQQAGGASVAIRKLVDDARRGSEPGDRARRAQEAAYRFMSVMAGNKPHYEEAIRALFAGNAAAFEKWIAGWPSDVRDHSRKLSTRSFDLASKARS
jgi:hypothetical protein